ncbi:MAG TPA: amidase, partial [Cytophagales bacterium]|nr:amidase [Cytophagales bacterium]
MTSSDYLAQDATGLAELIRNQEVTSVEVLEAAIARAEQLQPDLNFMAQPLF